MTLPIQFPVFVKLKDCGDVISFSSIISMRCAFERIDVENEEYQAWDATAHPLKMFVKQTPEQTTDFSQLLEMITLAVLMKRHNDSWWQKLKRRF